MVKRKVWIPILLVVVLATSLIFTSPLPIRAFDTSILTADSPSIGETETTALLGVDATIPAGTYLLGQQVSLPAYIEFDPLEFKDISLVQLELTGPEFSTSSTNPYTLVLPVTAGTYSYPANGLWDSTEPGVLDVIVTWAQGIEYVTGYGYGYGYGDTEAAKINYDIRWTSPYALSLPPSPPPTALPGRDFVFDIPVPPGGGSWAYPDQPQGLAYDSTNELLYSIVYANFDVGGGVLKDIIVKTDTLGNYDSFIPAPGTESWATEGITFVGTTLYCAYNEWDSSTFMTKGKVKKWNTSTTSWDTISGLSNLNPIGGLASDGTNLFVAYRDELRISKRNPTTGAEITIYDPSAAWSGGMGMGPPIWGFDALAYGSDLYAAQGDMIIALDPDTGDKTGDWLTGIWDIRGLSFVTESWGGTDYEILYMAATQWPGKVYKASKPEAMPVVEITPVGSYSAEFKVIANGTTYTETTNFTLDKLTTAPEVAISAPTSGFAKGAGDEVITVSGSVNDPSITQVSVGIALPTVTAFEDTNATEAEWQHSAVTGIMMWGPPYSSDDLWHRTQVRDHTGGDSWAWRYAVEATGNFNTPMQANAGALTTTDVISVGTDNTLTFWTYYDTETDFWMDRKYVEASTNGTTWQPLAWLAQFWPPFQPPDPNVDPAYFATLTQVSPWAWVQVEVSLADFAGQDIYLRFRFDTMDDWGNEGEGWFIDDISISGAGFLGVAVDVGTDLTFTTQFTLVEGSNTISVTANRTNYTPYLSGDASVTGSLDTAVPVVSIDTVTSPTNQNTQVITGTVTELNFDRLTLKVGGTEQYSTTVLTEVSTGVGTFTSTLTLSGGTNTILATVTDDAGLSGTATTAIVYDAVGPVFEDVFTSRYDVAYTTGEVSARPDDTFNICLKVTDAATGVAVVKLIIPDMPEAGWPTAMAKSELPEAVIDSWGIEAATKTAMNYVLSMQLPAGTPAGNYSWTVRAWDLAGNVTDLTPVYTSVVTSLEAFNIYLMPDWNLVSSPLIPTNTSIATLTTDIQATGLFEKVWYYDASAAGTADEWLLYEPGVTSDLTAIEAGKGYWFKMSNLAAFTTAGKVSAPMMTGLPNTPAPVKLTIAGEVLTAGAVVPPTYTVYAGWNLVGLHAEFSRPVTTALSSVTVPQQVWGSLLQYLNYIYFPMEQGAIPQIDLGRFDTLISTDTMQPGRGFWLYMVQSGTIVPS